MKKLNVFINEKEFAIQYESHPAYPSLLAVSDTLSFFNITNGALHVNAAEITSLPPIFMTKLKGNNDDSLAFVETQTANHSYTIYQNSKAITISKASLLEKWKGIIFLVESSVENQQERNKFTFHQYLIICCLLSLILLLKPLFSSFQQLLFFSFPLVGCVLSIFALKKVFNIHTTILDAFCGTTDKQNCATVVDSSVWKLFEKVNFSDLSITFFSFQIVMFSLAGITNTINFFFQTQSILLIAAIPIVLLSIYYQKFIIKKWCPICISIIGIFVLEFVYVATYIGFQFSMEATLFQYNLQLFIFLSLLISWHYLKGKLITINHLQSELIQANRFKRNYHIFKNTLFSNPKFALPQTYLLFGNSAAKITIDFMTSPYCGFCKAPYKMLRNFLKKHEKQIAVRFIYNVNLEKRGDPSKLLLRNLVHIHEKFGDEAFFNALDDFHETSNHEKWLKKHQHITDSENIDEMLQSQRLWCIEHKFTFTPCIFVNGYAYPKMYELSDLKYFIEELIDDKTTKLAEAEKLSTE
ncbi:thioredoxin domain-containing protein [Kordia sp. YSTF-M3]|uniref:Thioredoxin domain-containing protein n=1 Tax=Kordia aestuariivivens TaxID=2759037 RepID=A0ABR7QDF5_9FLAO|nr:vitamin K epoxide reductase family protein [Kordia aestuariivivens]MBC8756617.1 thioredoxin domain-containing protein [Kordia aestuariivivens]